jgi:NDP-sugar pyrophosphorylase family protein
MQIVIPMSGYGERFRAAGYRVPKPLIIVEDKPIIAHVIDMFPGEKDLIFICNQDHLDNGAYEMKDILKKYCPSGIIIGIPSHKLGPIHAVLQAKHLIDLNEPTIVNYCDFTCYWDWDHFKHITSDTNCDGAIPAYRGFHPHTLGTTNYAYLKEKTRLLADVQEKQPFTNDRMNEFASSGTYYFRTGELMLDAFSETIKNNINVNGEFYVSLAYKALLKNNNKVVVYPLQHFMQWGTPQDVDEYNYWSNVFKRLLEIKTSSQKSHGSLIIPMAGLGQRFIDEAYKEVKPLIPVSGKPMVIQAVNDLPNFDHQVFVLRKDMPNVEGIMARLSNTYNKSIIKCIPKATEGQACSALLGLDALENAIKGFVGPVTFSACDNGVIYNHEVFDSLMNDDGIDVIIWGIKGYANAIRHPKMYGWINENHGRVTDILVKTTPISTEDQPIIIGTFTFKKASDFRISVESLFNRNGRVNNEFYIDSAINDAIQLGLKCHYFEVDSFISWGTPNDLKTFEYWQSCFSKWPQHPYKLELDQRISREQIQDIRDSYEAIQAAL